MPLVDIAQLYRKHPNPRKPFSYFFNSRAYSQAYEYLKEQKKLPENHIIVRSMPYRGSPSSAKVHPLIVVEFVRWLDYGRYHDQMMKFYGVEP